MSFAKILLLCFLFLLLNCRSVTSVRQQIDQLGADARILQAEKFLQENERKWALYAWNQTDVEDLVSDDARESYHLLKNWLFGQTLAVSKEIQVSSMYLDSDDLWLGTWNGGIYRLSLSSGNNLVLERDTPSLVPKVVYRIRKSGNAFWFATHQGLRFYNYQTGSSGWMQMPGASGVVSDFLENPDGLFMASLTDGAWQRTIRGDILPLGNEQLKPTVTVLAYHNDIGLLIGTAAQGAFRWKNGVLENLQNLEPTFSRLRHVNHIVNDGRSLWFASSGEGLFRWNYTSNEVYQIISETFLLRSDKISALLHRGDWVFIGDEKGRIAGYHLRDQKWYIWDSDRNLEFGSISALAYRNGELFYSTLVGGVYQIHWLRYLFSLREKETNKKHRASQEKQRRHPKR